MSSELTQRLVRDASEGPGKMVKAFNAAAIIKGKLSAAHLAALQKYDGTLVGFTSKALIYDDAFRHASAAQLRALASLIKSGYMDVEEVRGPIPGAPASRVGAQSDRHYILRRVVR